jgi:glycosyltransferase involved in cell wall biosynthesis
VARSSRAPRSRPFGAPRQSLRVAILAEDGPLSACTRYRALQHLPRLTERLGRVDVLHHEDLAPRSRGVVARGAFFGRSAVDYCRVAVHIARAVKRYDAVLVQRGLYPLGPGSIVRGLERFDGRVVFDLDDAVFIGSPALHERPRPTRWIYGPQQALRLLRRADATVVSTEALASMLPTWAHADAVIPTVPDPERYPIARHVQERPVRIGWAGSMRNLPYLEIVRTTLRRLSDDGIADLEVVSSEPWSGPSTFRRWELAEEATVFARFGIGIMPLPDTPYTRAKAGFKLLQYMAAGVPVVASPVGINRQLVGDSGSGFLAEGPDEWEAAIRSLAGDAVLREHLGSRGRAFIERYADLDGQADALAELLRGPA